VNITCRPPARCSPDRTRTRGRAAAGFQAAVGDGGGSPPAMIFSLRSLGMKYTIVVVQRNGKKTQERAAWPRPRICGESMGRRVPIRRGAAWNLGAIVDVVPRSDCCRRDAPRNSRRGRYDAPSRPVTNPQSGVGCPADTADSAGARIPTRRMSSPVVRQPPSEGFLGLPKSTSDRTLADAEHLDDLGLSEASIEVQLQHLPFFIGQLFDGCV